MKDFTVASVAEAIPFKINDDIFTALPPDRLPGNTLIRYSEQVQNGKLYEANQTFFNRVLEDESAILFNHRLDSKDKPITLEVMTRVVEWLMEQYANLTTQGS